LAVDLDRGAPDLGDPSQVAHMIIGSITGER
jgi:hypothetical protein